MYDYFPIYRSSIGKEYGQLDAESSILNEHYPDSGYGKPFGQEQFYPVSSPLNGERKFSMSHNKSTRGRPDDLVEITTCVVKPSISYVVDSCNCSNDLKMDHVPVIDNVCTVANGMKGKVTPPSAASSSMNNADSASVVDQLQHLPTCFPTTATKPTCLPIPEHICEDENCDKRSSSHSVSSEETPSPDYPFLRVSSISFPAAPIKVHPPPSKLLNKRESKENGDSDFNPNSAAAAAAMKEAMEFAEARLKAAKELMERKGDSFKLRKRPAHHRSTKSTEIKGSKIPEEVNLFEENLSMRRLEKDKIQNKNLALPDNNTDMTAVKSVRCDPDKNVIISLGKPPEMLQNGSKLEEPGKWTSDAAFFELIGHDQRCKPNAVPSEGNNGLKNSSTKLDQTEKEKKPNAAPSEGNTGLKNSSNKLDQTEKEKKPNVALSEGNTGLKNSSNKLDQTEKEKKPNVALSEGNTGLKNSSNKLNQTEKEKKPNAAPSEGNTGLKNSSNKLNQTEREKKPNVALSEGNNGLKSFSTKLDQTEKEKNPNAAPSEGNNGLKNSSTNHDLTEKEKAMEFAGEPKRVRKLWDTTGLKRETVNLVKDGTSFVEVQHRAPRPSKVPFCEEMATDQEPTNTHFKHCPGMDLEGHDDDGKLDISFMNNTAEKVHENQEISEKEKTGGFAGELKRVRKLWDTNGLKRETVNLLKDGTSSVGVEHEGPRSPEVPFLEERMTYEEPINPHKQRQGLENSLEVHDYDDDDDDGRFEISCMNKIHAKVQPDMETSSSFSEDSLSGHWHDNKNYSDASAEETPVVGKSKQVDNKDETMCNSSTDQILCKHHNIPNIDEIKETQMNLSDPEESAESHETCGKEKLFDFGYEENIHNEIERENEATLGTLSHEERKNFGIAENSDAGEDFQDGDMDQDAGSPEKNVSPNEDGKGKYGDNDAYQFQEQGPLRSRDLENRIDTIEDTVSDGEEREAKGPMLESSEMTLVEEVLNHSSKEGEKSMDNSIWNNAEVYVEVNTSSDRDGSMFHSVSEVISDDGSDYAAKMNTWSNNLQASFSEACTRVQYLIQNARYSSAGKTDKSIPVKNLLEEDLREADREIPTEKCIPVVGQKNGGKMEEKDSEDSVSNMRLKDQHFFHLDSGTVPKFAEGTASDNVHKSREGNLNVQRTKERDNVKNTEAEVDEAAHVRLGEEKEWKIEKEKEDKERQSRELEEEKERELERAKDRLAVQRATREAHERAFDEARAKADRLALEKITLARQRASAEAREKEKKAIAEAAADKASREARLKAERAAVERATAEAHKRAIEKAKAAADTKDLMKRFRSSTNQVSHVIILTGLLHTNAPDFILGIL
jgi:hypothetical protein